MQNCHPPGTYDRRAAEIPMNVVLTVLYMYAVQRIGPYTHTSAAQRDHLD